MDETLPDVYRDRPQRCLLLRMYRVEYTVSMGYSSREAKNAYERARRARLAIAAGREPGKTGRPATGRTRPKSHGDRKAQYQRARERQRIRDGDNGRVETKHPIMDRAFEVARRYARPDRRSVLYYPLYEELVCVAALAICEGDDPDVAAKAYAAWDRSFLFHTAPLLLE